MSLDTICETPRSPTSIAVLLPWTRTFHPCLFLSSNSGNARVTAHLTAWTSLQNLGHVSIPQLTVDVLTTRQQNPPVTWSRLNLRRRSHRRRRLVEYSLGSQMPPRP